jgi:adenosylcobinamide-GDP ribazoletransferase
MKKLLLALQFLTIIPIKISRVEEREISGSAIYFPLAGLLLGLLLAGLNNLMASLGSSAMATSAIVVVTSIILTGGMHLDGLSDTFDAISSGKNREEMLAIMKDPHAGVMGVLSIISAILLKVALLSSLNSVTRALAIIITMTLSRWSLVLSMSLSTYARQQGKAKILMEGRKKRTLLLATLLTLAAITLIYPGRCFFVMAIVAVTSLLFNKSIAKKFNGITGDTLGAINEINEIAALACIFLLERQLL